MIVDVLYEGLPLAKGATARQEGAGAFIELEAPMPVGTRLTVRGPEGERQARVEHVHEGVGPGVMVKFVDGASLGDPGSERKASQVPQHSAAREPNAPEGPMETTSGGDTVPDDSEPAGGGETEPGPDPEKKSGRKDRRGKNRKTVAGH